MHSSLIAMNVLVDRRYLTPVNRRVHCRVAIKKRTSKVYIDSDSAQEANGEKRELELYVGAS
jgi:hypothetical protein